MLILNKLIRDAVVQHILFHWLLPDKASLVVWTSSCPGRHSNGGSILQTTVFLLSSCYEVTMGPTFLLWRKHHELIQHLMLRPKLLLCQWHLEINHGQISVMFVNRPENLIKFLHHGPAMKVHKNSLFSLGLCQASSASSLSTLSFCLALVHISCKRKTLAPWPCKWWQMDNFARDLTEVMMAIPVF